MLQKSPHSSTLTAVLLLAALSMLTGVTEAARTPWKFEWSNPKPTGNHLIQIGFTSADRGWIVADDGEVYRSTDGGDSWQDIGGGLGANDMVAAIIREKDILSVDSEGRIRKTSTEKIAWRRTDSLPGSLYDIRECGSQVLLAVGQSGLIARSADEGQSWRTVRTGLLGYPLLGLGCDASGHALAVGDEGLVLRSRDGGLHWDSLPSPVDELITGVTVADSLRAILVTERGTAAVTVDGGRSWRTSIIDSEYFVRHVRWQNGVILASGSDGGIWKSADEGMTWTASPPVTGLYLAASALAPSGREFLVGNSGVILKREENSGSWHFVSQGPHTALQGMTVLAPSIWLAYGQDGLILKTTDAGQTWEEKAGTDLYLAGSFQGEEKRRGILAGYHGVLSYTEDGGETWAESSTSPKVGVIFGVAWSDSLSAIAVGQYGGWWKTGDGGHSWEALPPHPDLNGENLSGIGFRDAKEGFIVGYQGVMMRTQDGGSHWSKVALPTTENLYGFAFRDSRVGMAVGAHGTALVTRDGGETWVAQNTGSPDDYLFTVSWLGGDTALVSGAWGHYSVIRMTTDFGKTWIPLEVPTEIVVFNMASIGPGRVALVGDRGMVLLAESPPPILLPQTPWPSDPAGAFSVRGAGMPSLVRAQMTLPFAGEVTLTLHALDGRSSKTLFRSALASGDHALTLLLPPHRGPALFRLLLKADGKSFKRQAWWGQ